MSLLRGDDHARTRAFLAQIERKGLPAPVFSGYGGQGYGSSGGMFGSALFSPWLPGAKFDYEAEAGDTWRNSAVASCLAWIADNLAEPDLRVVAIARDGTREPVPNHPLIRLLRDPNPYYGWHTLVKALVLGYRTDGNAYWMLARGADGMPLGLYPIPHFRIWPRWSTGGDEYLGWWDYQVDGRIIRLDPDAVVHFRDGVDPYHDRLGCAALKHNLRELCSDNEFAGYTASLGRNMGVVPYVISPGEAGAMIAPEDQDDIADRFGEKFTRENRGKPLVASGALKIDRLGLSPEEMALDRITQIPESRICAALRVPAMVVGLAVGAEQRTFSNYAEARKAAYEDGIIPFAKEVAWVINKVLLPRLGNPATEEFEFDFGRVAGLSEGEDAKALRWGDAYQKNRIVTLNEARTAGFGLDPVPGGDRFADGSTPEEGPSAPPPPPAPGEMPAGPGEHGEDGEDAPEAKALLARADEVIALARKVIGGAA